MEDKPEKRITYKRARPNPLFQDWLEELHAEAKTKKSKLEGMLTEALSSLSKYPLPLQSGAECAILKGFDKRLCIFLDKRLEVYYKIMQSKGSVEPASRSSSKEGYQNSQSIDEDSHTSETSNHTSQSNNQDIHSNQESQSSSHCNSPATNSSTQTRSNTNSQEPTQGPRKKNAKKEYKPAYRSGGYALLVALLEYSVERPDNQFINKEDLIERAQRHSEESFVRPKPETFYTAWSNMTRLLTKGLVTKVRKKKVEFSLTDTGKQLAKKLLEDNKNRTTLNEVIFNGAPQQTETEDMVDIIETVGLETQTLNSVSQTALRDTEASSSSHSSQIPEILIELPSGSFDVILLIDKCETGGHTKKNEPMVAQINNYPDLVHDYRSLKVGDFTWIARHKTDKSKELVLPYIIERKRMDDLGGSIKDGRFHEQKFRLRKCNLDNVIYLVENYGGNKHVGLPIQTLKQALANTRVVDGFMVHVTNSLNCTVRFLAMMTKRLSIEFKDKHLKGANHEPQNGTLMTFDYFNKSAAKNKPLTITDTFVKLLLQLKGVSVEKALAITNVYKTPVSLIKAYENCSRTEGEMLLAKLRSIGPKISKAVYHVFTITHDQVPSSSFRDRFVDFQSHLNCVTHQSM